MVVQFLHTFVSDKTERKRSLHTETDVDILWWKLVPFIIRRDMSFTDDGGEYSFQTDTNSNGGESFPLM